MAENNDPQERTTEALEWMTQYRKEKNETCSLTEEELQGLGVSIKTAGDIGAMLLKEEDIGSLDDLNQRTRLRLHNLYVQKNTELLDTVSSAIIRVLTAYASKETYIDLEESIKTFGYEATNTIVTATETLGIPNKIKSYVNDFDFDQTILPPDIKEYQMGELVTKSPIDHSENTRDFVRSLTDSYKLGRSSALEQCV